MSTLELTFAPLRNEDYAIDLIHSISSSLMPKIINDDGTELDIDLEALQAKASEAEALKAEAESAKAELATIKPELDKLKDKDLNFSRLRNAKESELSEEKKAELAAMEASIQKVLEDGKKQFEDLTRAQQEFIAARSKAAEEEAVKSLVGNNGELAEKVAVALKKFPQWKTQEELIEHTKAAFVLATGSPYKPIPSYSGYGAGGQHNSAGEPTGAAGRLAEMLKLKEREAMKPTGGSAATSISLRDFNQTNQ